MIETAVGYFLCVFVWPLQRLPHPSIICSSNYYYYYRRWHLYVYKTYWPPTSPPPLFRFALVHTATKTLQYFPCPTCIAIKMSVFGIWINTFSDMILKNAYIGSVLSKFTPACKPFPMQILVYIKFVLGNAIKKFCCCVVSLTWPWKTLFGSSGRSF